jgi:alpha-D-ribose 1-methylphosphonate 5-triphosphate diphosphatase
VVELIEQAKARGAAIVGIFHDEGTPSGRRPTAPDGNDSMIINNVKLVLDDVVHGSLEVQDGASSPLPKARAAPQALDGEGGWLLPGLIELHTDNLDKFFTPRPKVDWPAHSAMSSHDAHDGRQRHHHRAGRRGDWRRARWRRSSENLEKMINAVEETQKRGLNRAEHRLHLRCELPHHTTLPLFEKLVGRESVSMVSDGPLAGPASVRRSQQVPRILSGQISSDDDEMDRFEAEQMALAATWSQPNRQTIAAMCRARNIALASHDDATDAHVANPTSLAA